ncbi:MAG: SMP-30/gluconolactonase/LRE family protein [Candidatus Zixiibacteriota bacterium]|nr:MAG: SMP-30/gluconolactonase/LRE family protein [candidate division Zixibacteria bacterium]
MRGIFSAIIGSCLLLAAFTTGRAQLLNGPESVVYDTLYDRYLISNWNTGNIVQMDSEGVQSYFVTGQGCQAGLEIVDDVVYVGCSGLGVKGYDLHTGSLVAHVTIPGSVLLNDITSDTSGNLYVSDPYGDEIYKIRLSDLSYSSLVPLIEWPNGVLYDRQNDRLLTCGSTTRNIYSVDRDDGSLTLIIQVEDGHLDGLADDSAGNIYISAQGPDVVYRYDSDFSIPPEIVSRYHNGPADIFYNKPDNVLAIPNIGGVSVDFIDFSIPNLSFCGLTVVDAEEITTDRVHPGETADIFPVICNSGYTVSGVAATMTSFNIFVTVNESEAAFSGSLPEGGKAASATPFSVSIHPNCPVPSVAVLGLQITADNEYIKEDTLLLFIGDASGFHDDMESGPGYWRHRSLSRLFRDYWFRDEICYHSGLRSWKAGNPISYYSLTDAELVSPPFLLERHSRVTLWHRIGAEEGVEPGTARDGGLVSILTMDGVKTQIVPDGGYTHTTVVGSSSPLRTETPVFSGDYDWAEVGFDLAGYSGVVQLAFRFASDGAIGGTGWCLDDIEVAVDQATCCEGLTGNVDYDPDDIADIGDLTALIDFLFISFEGPICMAEANVDGVEPVDIGDLTALIDFLFISYTPPAVCP